MERVKQLSPPVLAVFTGLRMGNSSNNRPYMHHDQSRYSNSK
ncbi:hypothetical protein RchiOBHm_Chr5g0062401 [Rosa chinensis]|uniref:Uncharacterized protein n=1 Tax=Rosa chinensis TaxID=74649 RepID=A0A2P6QI62_ROSCH|nr:hypothetical protein RchiOBHm_Chr5g0062401 [Rosa chinensis]